MNEIWKDIEEYEGLYQVNSLGQIKNVRHNHILKGHKMKNGYITVMLSKNKKHKRKYVHRIVAETFLDNTDNYKIVNHKDFNRTNNNLNNLEWCSQKYNVLYSYLNNRMPLPPAQKPKKIKRNDGKIYNSIEEAGKDMKIHPSIICNQLKNRQKTAKGYTFMYLQ